MNVRKASLRPFVAGSGSSSTMSFISYYMVFVEEKPLISTAATQPTCRNFYQTLQPSLKFETVTRSCFQCGKNRHSRAVAILWQPSGEGTVSETFEDRQRPKSVAGRRARLSGGFWVLLRTRFEVLLWLVLNYLLWEILIFLAVKKFSHAFFLLFRGII